MLSIEIFPSHSVSQMGSSLKENLKYSCFKCYVSTVQQSELEGVY